MTRGRIAAILCIAAAIGCLASAFWTGFEIARPALSWERSEGVIEGARLRTRHDGQAVLVYYMEAKMAFRCGGQAFNEIVASDFHTYEFAAIRALLRQRPAGTKERIFCDPANSANPRFAIDHSRIYAGIPAALAAAGVLLLASGHWLWRNWLPPVSCARCRMPLKRYYKFCPHCRAPLSPQIASDSA